MSVLSLFQSQTATVSGPLGTATATVEIQQNLRINNQLNSGLNTLENVSSLDSDAVQTEISSDGQSLLERALEEREIALEIIAQLEAITSSDEEEINNQEDNNDDTAIRLANTIGATTNVDLSNGETLTVGNLTVEARGENLFVSNDGVTTYGYAGLELDGNDIVADSYNAITASSDSAVIANSFNSISLAGDDFAVAAFDNNAIAATGDDGSIRAVSGNAISTLGNDTLISVRDNNAISVGGNNNYVSVFENNTISAQTNDSSFNAYSLIARDGLGRQNVFNVTGNNNSIQTGSQSTITLNGQNNRVETGAGSTVQSGFGDDTITAGDNSVINSGDGNDIINISDVGASGLLNGYTPLSNSTINAGAGNDTIIVNNQTDIIQFNRGDANDVINSRRGGVTIEFGPDITAADITVARGDDNTLIASINGSEDSLTIDANSGDTNFVFADGETVQIRGENSNREQRPRFNFFV